MASIIKADTLQSTTSNVFVLNSAGTEYARFDSSGVFQLANPTTFPAGTAALPSITATGDTNTGIFFPAADTIAFAEGGVESVRIDSSGNVKMTAANTKILNSSGNSILNQTGSVLQVVQASKTDTFSTTSGTGSPATITGLSASITPSSTTSKVLVLVNFGQISASGDSTFGIFMFRNATKIDAGDAAGSRTVGSIAGGVPGNGATWRGFSGSIMFLDSPSSTSAVSYTFSLGGNGSTTIYLNQDGRNNDIANDSTRTPITVILMEIAG